MVKRSLGLCAIIECKFIKCFNALRVDCYNFCGTAVRIADLIANMNIAHALWAEWSMN